MPLKGPKPLPTSIRVGTDIVHLPRFHRIIKSYKKERLEAWGSRIFSPLELPTWQSLLELYPEQVDFLRLGRFMAGRWAMKEAAIKAHSHRRLYPRDVSILAEVPRFLNDSSAELESDVKYLKPRVYIEPPSRTVLIEDRIALARGLDLRRNIISSNQSSDIARRLRLHYPDLNWEENVYERPAAVRWEDRQEADGSLSHDGEYAFAVVQALDEPVEADSRPLVDDGYGMPKHIPLRGDYEQEGSYDLQFNKAEVDRVVGYEPKRIIDKTKEPIVGTDPKAKSRGFANVRIAYLKKDKPEVDISVSRMVESIKTLRKSEKED